MCSISMILQQSRRGDQDIVHIDNNFDSVFCPFVFEWSENVVHHILKGSGGVTEAKVHDHGFV